MITLALFFYQVAKLNALSKCKVPCTRIQIFFQFATFSFEIQKFPGPHVTPSVFKSNSPVHTNTSHGIRNHSRETRPIRCAAILAYCSVRDWVRFNYAFGLNLNIRIRCLHVGFVADFFSRSVERI